MNDDKFLAGLLTDTDVSRRGFLKWSAALGGAAVLANGGLAFGMEQAEPAPSGQPLAAEGATKIVWNACNVNCGSRCPLRVHVRNGEVVRIEPDNTGSEKFGDFQIRACVRGRSVRHRIYNADRLKYPMKRVGKRGEGKFAQISWEEALDTIANSMKSIKEKYGNEAFYINYATGSLGAFLRRSWPPGTSFIARLMNAYGGYLNHYGTYSTAEIAAAMPYTYGANSGNSIDDIVNSKLVVIFGNDPSSTRMSGGGVVYFLQQAKKIGGAKVIVIDPLYTDTAATVGDEWVPIRPGSDAALVSAMAHVMITEKLVDQAFLDKYCVGYDDAHLPEGVPAGSSYKAYILGEGPDKTIKTPAWAAPITGIPERTIVRLAREIALTKPAYIVQGWGPQRQASGEQTCRAIAMLPILTGNVGISGGNTGAREGAFGLPFPAFPSLENPVKTSISVFMWTDAIERGDQMTALADGVRGADKLKVPIKFIWNYAGNCLVNQHSDAGRTIKLLQDESKCEMIVVSENHMTASAKVADILLPDVSMLEVDDIVTQGSSGNMGYVIFASKAIEPMFECRNIYDVCTELSKRLGIADKFTEGKSYDDWLRWTVDEARKKIPELPEFDKFREMGIFRKNAKAPIVALKAFRDDPDKNKLTTPSGKIEIYSKALDDISKKWKLPEGDVITALPIYTPTWETPSDPLSKKYPLQMIGQHFKQRTHSTYGNVDWMKEAVPQEVWINAADAEARGITHGDMVKVFNDRGTIVLPAKVTVRITPGVISVPQGAWYNPDANGVDRGGCVNTLTSWRPSPLAKGNPQHTNLVQVVKA